ncbi:hypothetical protein EUX98_g6747 [Antrodiella citrinella]|uniref:Mitochondrial ATPase complex subunit ATP10 n=1 Tax=Antrodiella citrinella TaxID=2447956 RepID=A0A4S4MQR3_9APHY|nr:hypothetical protein EUX98_g6747 [Antrodiella citrinella]
MFALRHALRPPPPQKSLKGIDEVAEKVIEDDDLPFLSRPLGVKEKPSTIPMTWRQEMMDQDVRMKHRQKLVKEATKGYFTDLNATRKHGGKTWVAPRVLIREDKALYFPDMVGTDLNSQKVHTTDLLRGKITVLGILSTKISEIQTKMFTQPTNIAYSTHPSYQFVRINLQENLLKSFLISMFTKSIRRQMHEQHWGRYLISSQNLDYVRDDVGITNKHVGYVFLIDENCKIRWAGCADPKPEEVEALNVCTGVLLKRHPTPSSGPLGA